MPPGRVQNPTLRPRMPRSQKDHLQREAPHPHDPLLLESITQSQLCEARRYGDRLYQFEGLEVNVLLNLNDCCVFDLFHQSLFMRLPAFDNQITELLEQCLIYSDQPQF